MKKIFISTIILLIPFTVNAQKSKDQPVFVDAVEYNDYIVDHVDTLSDLWTLAIEEEDLKKAMKWNNALKKEATKTVATLQKIQGFQGDVNFKNAAISYAQHFIKITKKDLPEFLKIIRKKGDLSVDDEKKAETYLPELDDKREYLFDQVEKMQYAFADKTGIEIEGRYENEGLSDYEERSNFTEPSDYHNYIVDMVDIIDHYWTLAIEAEMKETALAYTDTLRMRTDKILGSLKKLGPFKGYDTMRMRATDYAVHMNNISKKELVEFINIIRAEEMNTQSEKRAESLIPILDDKREALFARIEEEQKVMGQKFGFSIVK